MSTRRKLCNLCKAELKVPLEAQIVPCPACGAINGYGAPLTGPKAPPSKMNTGYAAPATSQYDNYANAPKARTSSPAQTSPQARTSSPPQEPPRPLGINSFLPPQVQASPPPQVSPPIQTSTPTQTPPPPTQTPPPPTQTSPPPRGSPHSNNNIYRPSVRTQIPTHTTPPTQTQPSLPTHTTPAQTLPHTHLSPPIQVSPPQASTRPNSFNPPPPPPQTSLPAQTSPPLDSLRPAHSNSHHQQPLQASSPHSSLTPTDSVPQTSPHPPSPHVSPPRVHGSGLNQIPQPFPQISRPQVYTSGYYQQPLQDSRPVSSPNISPFLMHGMWEDQRIHQYADYIGTRQGISVLHSAYEDHQKSGATTVFTGNSSGALPYGFIRAAIKEPTSTYEHIPTSIRNKMSEAGASAFGIRKF